MGNTRRILSVVLLCFFLFGCASVKRNIINPDKYRRGDYIASHPTLSQKMKQAIREGRVYVGMDEEEVLASWGPPDEKSENLSNISSLIKWGYNLPDHHRAYLYFKDGKLETFTKI